MTLTELIEAYKRGEPEGSPMTLGPLWIDNDNTGAERHNADWTEVEDVFRMHPGDLLEQLLDYVGIPHEPA